MSAVARLCKKAILLEKGRLINEGPAHQVVGEYLYSSGSITPSKEWLDPETAPRNDTIRLRSLRVRTETEFVKDSVDIGESIGIALEFDVLQPGQILVPNFLLHTEGGVVVFETYDRDPAWLRRSRPIGRYTSTAWIPGHLLTEGTLIVNCAIITEVPFRAHCYVPDVVAFHVHESGVGISARSDYAGDMLGVIRPLLKWTTDHGSRSR
jgi:lipopolysaccharide transport system ATP-binding protein